MSIPPDAIIGLSTGLKAMVASVDGSEFSARISGRFYDSAQPADVDLPSPYATYTIDKGRPIAIMGDGLRDGEAIPFTLSIWSRSPSKEEVIEVGALAHHLFRRAKLDMIGGSYYCVQCFVAVTPSVRRINPFWGWQATYMVYCSPDVSV